MKIFISQHPDLRVYGLAKALQTVVPTTSFWDRNSLPLFDLMNDHKPDIVIYHDADANDRGVELAMEEFPDTKFIFLQFMPTLSFAQPALTIAMADMVAGSADMVMDYVTNFVDMDNGEENSRFATNVITLTDNVDTNDKFKMLALRALSHKFRTKIYGGNRIPIPNYLGQLRHEDYRHAFASAKVFVGFDHQRLHDACYHNCTPLIFSTEKKEAYTFRSINELLEKCESAIAGERLMDNSVTMAYQNTYHHTLLEIFDRLGMENLKETTNKRIYEYDRRSC